MAKVNKGEKALDFTFDTLYEQGLKLSDVVKNADKTVIHFLRYYGCTVCQLDLKDYAKKIDLIKDKNAQLYCVLQSKPETVKASMGDTTFPYDIICDPDQKIYKLYDIGSWESVDQIRNEKLAAKGARCQAEGLAHGEYEGNEEQLPAMFIMDKDMNLEYVLYSQDLTSIPSVEEVAEML